MQRDPARAMLIDLDGVLRRWDPSIAAGVEKSYHLETGLLTRTVRCPTSTSTDGVFPRPGTRAR